MKSAILDDLHVHLRNSSICNFFISEQKPKVWVVIFLVRSYFSDFSDCGKPDIPHGGLSITSVTVFDGTSTVECDAGYEVIGSTTATCLASKIWDTLPICHPKGTFYFNPFHSYTRRLPYTCTY